MKWIIVCFGYSYIATVGDDITVVACALCGGKQELMI